jgi:hypothetical protein
MKMVTRLVSFGGKRPGTMAPLIVPPPSRSQPQISGGVLAAALAARWPGVSHSLPVSGGFIRLVAVAARSSKRCARFLKLITLSMPGKFPTHERRSLTERGSP